MQDEYTENTDPRLDTAAMDEEELLEIVRGKLSDAKDFTDNWLSPDRAKATEYYLSREFGDEEEGRSQYVDSTLRDTVLSIMPSLLKIFFSSERVVNFIPRQPNDVPFAEQATEYCRWLFTQKNNGFLTLRQVFLDALIRGNGFLKCYYENEKDIQSVKYTGLDDMTLAALMNDPEVEITNVDSTPTGQMEGVPMEQVPMTHDVTIVRRTEGGSIKIEAIPPEELLMNRRNKGFDDKSLHFICHRREMTLGELASMGYDIDELKDYASAEHYLDYNEEYYTRRPESQYQEDSPRTEEAGKLIMYYEIYTRIDYDGDGHQEWRRICLAGEEGESILMNEPCNGHPFINFCPFQEAHDFTGMSMWHMLRDIQRVKSNVLRSMLDSLSLSVHPRMAFVDGQVSVSDLMNNQVGSLIRMRAPNAVQPLSVPYTGQQAQPMLDYFDAIREERTGVTKAAAGLDPETLQSSTRVGVQNTISQAHEKIGMIARMIAEGGMKQLFKLLLRLVVEHQDKDMMIRLRDQWVPMQPQSWDVTMDVEVNVGLGAQDQSSQLQTLNAIAAKQEGILQLVGPENPLVNVKQLYNTYSKMVELAGYKNVGEFFKDPALEPPKPPAPPEPSPEQLLAQVQMQEIQARMAIEKAKLELDENKAQVDAALKQADMETDAALRMAELKAKYHTTIDSAELRGIIDTQREVIRQQGLLEQARINKSGEEDE